MFFISGPVMAIVYFHLSENRCISGYINGCDCDFFRSDNVLSDSRLHHVAKHLFLSGAYRHVL